jgi:CRP-like cAMP-binding protein
VALDRDVDMLSRVPLFANWEREALRLLAFAAETRLMRAGDVLFRRGETADGGYLVVSGSIALDARDDGSPAGQVAGPGHLIGETALLIEVARPATAIAREATSVLRLPRRIVARVLTEFPDSAERLRSELAARLQDLSRDLAGVRDHLLAIDRDGPRA